MKRINLLPRSWLDQRERGRARHTAVVLVCAALPLLLVLGGLWFRQSRQLQNDIRFQTQRIADLTGQVARMEGVVKAKTVLQRQLAERRTLVLPLATTRTMALLVACMPQRLALTQLIIEAPLPTVSDGADAHKSSAAKAASAPFGLLPPTALKMHGYAADDLTVANFVNQVAQQPLFQDLKLGMSKQVRLKDSSLQEFYLTMTVPMNRQFAMGAWHD